MLDTTHCCRNTSVQIRHRIQLQRRLRAPKTSSAEIPILRTLRAFHGRSVARRLSFLTLWDWEITLAGKLNLHRVEKPLTLPLRVHLEGGRLDAKGQTYVSRTEFGMTPIKLAGGAVKVRDRAKISFAIMAKRSNL